MPAPSGDHKRLDTDRLSMSTTDEEGPVRSVTDAAGTTRSVYAQGGAGPSMTAENRWSMLVAVSGG